MITRKRDIWLVALLLTFMTNLCVMLYNMAFYPREQWLFEFVTSAILTTVLTFAFSYMLCRQIYRNAQLVAELQRLVDRDRLTDVATRDFFYARLADNAEAYGVSLMIDIDHFKSVNDTHGHAIGDRVLHAVAQVLRDNCREDDIVCRHGGEEFVVFLAKTGPREGKEMAERLRAKVAEKVTSTGARNVRVTISIGGSLKDRTTSIEAAIAEADRALYRAKALGRNRVIFLRPTQEEAA